MARAAVSKEISARESKGSALLWFGVLGGPIAWVTQLAVNYSLEEWFACSPGSSTTGSILGFNTTTIAFAITIAVGVIALLAGIVSVVCYRRIGAASGGDLEIRARWMALAGIMNSILYFIIILASFGPPLLLRSCEVSP